MCFRKAWRYRWFILGVLCLLVNAGGIVHRVWTDAGVRIRSFNAGVDGLVSGRTPLTWRFTAPVVGASLVNRWDIPDVLTLSPQVPGRLRWTSPHVLSFEPLDPWPLCTSFEARLSDSLMSVNGQYVDVRKSFKFASSPLCLESVRETNVDAQGGHSLELTFNAPPRSDALPGLLTLSTPSGKLGYSVPNQEPSHKVWIKTESVSDRRITVQLAGGLIPAVGDLGMVAPAACELELLPELVVTRVQGASPSFGKCSIVIEFNSAVPANTLAEHVDVSPPAKFAASGDHGWRNGSCELTGEFEPGRAYRIAFTKGLKAANGRELLQSVTNQIVMPDRPAGIAIKTTGHYRSPRGSMQLPVHTANVDKFVVTAERVQAANLVQYWMRRHGKYANYYGRQADHHRNISEWMGEATYHPVSTHGEDVRTTVDLRGICGKDSTGAFLVRAMAGNKSDSHLVVVSDIGITVKQCADELLVWANSLNTLEPVTNARVRTFSSANKELADGLTDREGLARLDCKQGDPQAGPFLVTVETASDLAGLCLEGTRTPVDGDTGGAAYLGDSLEAFVYTDRGIYRPGETGHVAVIVRDAELTCPAPFPLCLTVFRPDGVELAQTNQVLDHTASAAFDVALAENTPTGRYRCRARIPGGNVLGECTFLVEDFLPPRIMVDAVISAARVRDHLDVKVAARYLFGPPAAGLRASVSVVLREALFTSKDHPGYTFSDGEKSLSQQTAALGARFLGENGGVSFDYAIPRLRPPSGLLAVVCSTVTESNGRAVSAYDSVPVDCYPRYVGIRPERPLVDVEAAGDVRLNVLAVTPSGENDASVDTVLIRFARISWSTVLTEQDDGTQRYRSTRYLETVDEHPVQLTGGAGSVTVVPPGPGNYLVQICDGDRASASIQFYARHEGQSWQPWAQDRPGTAVLELDQDDYAPGSEARLLIKSPFTGKALVTVESDRILELWTVTMTCNTATVSIPVKDMYGPNAYCVVSVIRPVNAVAQLDGDAGQWSPHRAVGVIPLRVRDERRHLGVSISAPDQMEPCNVLPLEVRVTNREGRPVQARLTVAAIDKGICMLTAFQTPNPFAFFKRKRAWGTAQYDLYGLLMPETIRQVQGSTSAPGGDGGSGLGGRLNPIRSRRYVPVALWRHDIVTDADGRATVALQVPEFSGQLSLMAVASSTDGVGCAVGVTTVSRPVVVLSGLPRFLAPGDRCRIPITVMNNSDTSRTVSLAIETEGPVGCDGTNDGETVTSVQLPPLNLAPASESALGVSLEAKATPGKAVVTIRASYDGVQFFLERTEIAVRPASPHVSSVTNGVLAAGESIRVPLLHGWLSGTESHNAVISVLPVPHLEGATQYLLRYPHGCLEQTTSRALPLIYAEGLLAHSPSLASSSGGIAHYIRAGVDRVLSMQQTDGSFGYWPGTKDTYRWGSVYATHFLTEAVKSGHRVSRGPYDAALAWLDGMLAKPLQQDAGSCSSPSLVDELGTRAYACYVLALAGHDIGNWVARLKELSDSMDSDAQGMLAAALATSGRRRDARQLLAQVPNDAPGKADSSTSDRLCSPTRTAAILLAAWLDIDPEHPNIPRLVDQLLQQQRHGRWRNTQDNAYALLALGKYCTRVLTTPQKAAAAMEWVEPGGRTIRMATSNGNASTGAPSSQVTSVLFTNAGPSTVYYTASSAGVPGSTTPDPVDAGLRVRRTWLDSNGNAISNTVSQGDLVVGRISIDSQGQTVDSIAIQDLLPAGLEIENARLVTSQTLPWVKQRTTLKTQHIEIRDDRLVLFVHELRGQGVFFYAARAVTPGTYLSPPIAAECMYDEAVQSVGFTANLTVTEL